MNLSQSIMGCTFVKWILICGYYQSVAFAPKPPIALPIIIISYMVPCSYIHSLLRTAHYFRHNMISFQWQTGSFEECDNVNSMIILLHHLTNRLSHFITLWPLTVQMWVNNNRSHPHCFMSSASCYYIHKSQYIYIVVNYQ